MRYLSFILLSSLLVFHLSAEERWNYISQRMDSPEGTEKFIEYMRESKKVGVTHILWKGSRGTRIPDQPEDYYVRAKRVLDEAKKLNMKIIPTIFSIGWSGTYFHLDSNLAAAVPAKNTPFIVKDRVAKVDPGIGLDVSQLKQKDGKLTGTFKVRPFTNYRIRYSLAQKPESRKTIYKVTSHQEKRDNSYAWPWIYPKGDRHLITGRFNTLDADEIKITINSRWSDLRDFEIVPAGLLLVVRQDRLPMVVMNEDRTITYVEGKDFEEVKDSQLNIRPFTGDFFINHEEPHIQLTPNSRIQEGQRLIVDYWHHQNVREEQDMVSIENPKMFDIMDFEMKNVAKAWPAEGYMMNYDEIRIGGWEPQTFDPPLSTGKLLANHVERAIKIIKKYKPNAKIYTWSDMFTPHHNAGPKEDKYYYLVKGSFEGAWEGLDKDVIIFNWYSPDDKTPKFFANRGHKQIWCGYYDHKTEDRMKGLIHRWKKAMNGVPNVSGVMYTTWHKNFEPMPRWFELLETYDSWKSELNKK